MSNNQGASMFKTGDTVWTRYAGQVWTGEILAVMGGGLLKVDRLPMSGMVSKERCFSSELALLDAYEAAERIATGARYRVAKMRDEARELETQAEHLRRSAFEVERDAPAEADAAIATAPR